ncbi:hypothetical protein [Burkholderia contaminans]|uniref:hypothetical protein n=1 Tax=Burkholderia contaminans TaxID=488447 RepID=UPI00158AD278|nr:hypothetical protein [Burkholderia contaminans]
MATRSITPDLYETLLRAKVSFRSTYLIASLAPEHPIWPADAPDGPFPVYCLEIGHRVRCPTHSTENHSARTIGMDGEACGVLCDDCKTVYTARELPSNKPPLDGKLPATSQTFTNTFVSTEDVTASMPAGYRLERIEDFYPIWSPDLKDGPFTLSSHGVGEEVLFPTHLTQHPPARTISGEWATGIICHECKAVYARPSVIPNWAMRKISCIPHYRQDKAILLSANVAEGSNDDSTE